MSPAATRQAFEPPLADFLSQVRSVPYQLSPDALVLNPLHPTLAPIEEFRALRTRLNHMQRSQHLRTVVISSASPAEGKSFSATNLALVEAQLSGHRVLLCDFDLRRPMIHKIFELDRGPGVTDYLLGKVTLPQALRRIGDSNLYVMPAG